MYFDDADPIVFSADNPIAWMIGIGGLLLLAYALLEAFFEFSQSMGVFKTLLFFVWEAAFFPLLYFGQKHLGWWAVPMLLVWLLVTVQLLPSARKQDSKGD